jgi:hypothetical protein
MNHEYSIIQLNDPNVEQLINDLMMHFDDDELDLRWMKDVAYINECDVRENHT